jgi:hypothetical protein
VGWIVASQAQAEVTGQTREDRVTKLMEKLAQLDAEQALKAAGDCILDKPIRITLG